MTTLIRETVKAVWHITEDYPAVDGDYLVCFLKTDGNYGWPEVWSFTAREGWDCGFDVMPDGWPTHWCNIPMPRT